MLFPTGDKVLVKPLAPKTQTDGGLVIPTVALEQPNRGTIQGVGPDVKTLKVGQVAVYSKYAGIEVEEDGSLWLLIPECDVLATSVFVDTVGSPSPGTPGTSIETGISLGD